MAFAGRFLSRNLQDSNTHLGRWGDSGYAVQGNRAFIVSHTTYTIIITTTITITINVTNKKLTSLSPCSISSSPWVPAMNLESAVIYSTNERASGELLHLSSNEFPPTTFFIDVTFWCHYPYIHYLSLSEPQFITNVQE